MRYTPQYSNQVSAAVLIAAEIEKLKRRVLCVDRVGNDQSRRVAFVYRAADRFGRRVFPHTFCMVEAASEGCNTGKCCKCRPDVFQYEQELLDLLPKEVDNSGYCPFFNPARKNCGIYQSRPIACRIYYNFAHSAYYCQNPNDMTLQLLDGLKRHLEKVLGPYRGGYSPASLHTGTNEVCSRAK